MAVDFNTAQDVQKAFSEYSGHDKYMLYLKEHYTDNMLGLTPDMADYVLNNQKERNVSVGKTVQVSDDFAEKRKAKWNIDFLPKNIFVKSIVGESKSIVAVMGKYRQFMEEEYMLIPKSAIINNTLPTTLLAKVYTTTSSTVTNKSGISYTVRDIKKEMEFVKIDFAKYDKLSKKLFEEGKGNGKYAVKLMPHQKEAIKFMVASKKCILADGCGLGKTVSTIVSALECKFKKILVICPASVKSTWKREISTYEDPELISVVKNKKWKESKWTIINYDILKNFYTIAEEIKYIEENNIDENGKIKKTRMIDWKVEPVFDENGNLKEGTGIPKMKQSRSKALVEQALKESQLYLSNFDLVIIDECHRLSNSGSNMCKIVQDLLKHLKPEGIFAISGTPMTNRPMNFYNILKLIGHPIASNWQNYVERYCDGLQIPLKGEWQKWFPSFSARHGNKSWGQLSKEEQSEFRSYLSKYGKCAWKTSGASNLDELRTFTADCYIRRINTEIKGMVKKQIIVKDYDMSDKQADEYAKVWDKYKAKCEELGVSVNDENRQLTEGIKLRQYLSKEMLEKTIDLAEKHLEEGSKVLIMCNYDEELYELQKHFEKKKTGCVIYNGKMSASQKDGAEKEFMNNPDVKVFIGNIVACGVGLTLTAGNIVIFNSFSWIPSDNQQAMDRAFRITQKENVTVYFQLFDDTYLVDMYEKVVAKEKIINQVVVKRG